MTTSYVDRPLAAPLVDASCAAFWSAAREKRLLTLEEAVRKMTSSTALKLRMKRKGFIMPGMDADMVVFGENRIRDVNTFENPRVYPEGIDYVLVNGEIAVDHGVHTGARPGKTPSSPSRADRTTCSTFPSKKW